MMLKKTGQRKAWVMRAIRVAACSALVLCGCAPDLAKIAGDYSHAVDSGEAALADTVRANIAARKMSDYQLIALDRPPLRFTSACNEILDLAASGGIVLSAGAPSEGDRQEALDARRKLLAAAAKECAVTEGAPTSISDGSDDRQPDPRRDPFYLCGIDTSRLSINDSNAGATGVQGARIRIPPLPPRVAAQADIMPALAAYANALKEAAEAKDIAELEAAAQRLVDSLTALAVQAGPYGVVAAPAVQAVGTAATTLTGVFLREKRFRLIKDVVIATDPAVRDSAAIVCHSALVLSYEIVRVGMIRLDDLLVTYNGLAIDSGSTLQEDRQIIGVVQDIDVAVVSVRDVSTADYAGAILGIAAAHTSLKAALENPEHDFTATKKLLEKLVVQFEEIQKATSALKTAGTE
jgi:hypothetical protein